MREGAPMRRNDPVSRTINSGGLPAYWGALELRTVVENVTSEEFSWQESHYDRNSRRGREVLFLIANQECVRATSEIIDITRSDAVDTTIKIDIDLSQITHEAIREGTGRLWLPVVVLAPQVASNAESISDQYRPEPDPFATVTNATGDMVAMVSNVDVRHQISAAMAEIIINMVVARWPYSEDEARPTGTRDQRLLLSAGIYRLLRRGFSRADQLTASMGVTPGTREGHSQSRIGNARMQLLSLLDSYARLLDEPAGRFPSTDADSDIISRTPKFAPEFVRRMTIVLGALAESVVIVVPLNRDSAPTVLTVRVPTRTLNSSHVRSLTRPPTWVLRPLGHLQLDMLLPFADADRQVQVYLPEGVYVPVDRGAAHPSVVIEVEPQAWKDLRVLMRQRPDPRQRDWPPPLKECLADLARAKMGAVQQILRQDDVYLTADRMDDSGDARRAAMVEARAKLDELHARLSMPWSFDG